MSDGFWLRWILRLILFPLCAVLANQRFWEWLYMRLPRKR